MAKELGLSLNAISHKAFRLGLKQREKGRPWTEEEKEYIRMNYRKIPTREIARKLNRSLDSIINSAGPLGISAGRPLPWSTEEKKYVIENYGKIPTQKIAENLRRSSTAVVAAAVKLNLTKKRVNKK